MIRKLAFASLIAITGCTASEAAQAPESQTDGCIIYQQDRCPTQQQIPNLNTTTTTTIDLSFLNTTTTTALPKYVPPAPTQPAGDDRWDRLAQCESGGNWQINTGNGFGGGLQFMHQSSYSTWLSFGGGEYAPHPWEASREQQIAVAERVLASSGWGAWPGCTSSFGWR